MLYNITTKNVGEKINYILKYILPVYYCYFVSLYQWTEWEYLVWFKKNNSGRDTNVARTKNDWHLYMATCCQIMRLSFLMYLNYIK